MLEFKDVIEILRILGPRDIETYKFCCIVEDVGKQGYSNLEKCII